MHAHKPLLRPLVVQKEMDPVQTFPSCWMHIKTRLHVSQAPQCWLQLKRQPLLRPIWVQDEIHIELG